MGDPVVLTINSLRVLWAGDPAHERQPIAKVWITRDVSETVHKLDIPETARYSATEVGPLSLSFSTVQDTRLSLLERAKHCYVNLAFFVTMKNKNQETCYNQCGDARIPLYELLLGEASQHYRSGWTLTIPSWGDPNKGMANTDESIINNKGTLYFDGVSMVLPGGEIVPALTEAEIKTHENTQRFKDRLLYMYILSTVRFFGERRYKQDNLNEINAYVFAGHCGMLPSCAYLASRTGGGSPAYFEHVARIVFARHHLDPETFDWKRDPRAASLLSRVLTLPANLLVYVPDLVYFRSSKNPSAFITKTLESFDAAYARGGGDCEDLALAVIMCGLEILAAGKLDPGNSILSGLLWVKSQYVQCMVLGAVTSPEVNGDYGKSEELGSHMYTSLIKKHKFVQLWRKGNLFTPEEAAKMDLKPGQYADLEYARLAGLPDPDGPDPVPHLPDILIGEGTGFVIPEGTDDRHEALREQESWWYSVFNSVGNGAFRGMRQWFSYCPKASRKGSFYAFCTFVETTEFFHVPDPYKRRFVEFALCNRDQVGSTSVRFEDFVRPDPSRIALWAVPPLNEVETCAIRDSLRNLLPTPPFELPHGTTGRLPPINTVSPSRYEMAAAAASNHPQPPRFDTLQQQRLVNRLVTEVGGGLSYQAPIGTRYPTGGPDEPIRIPDVLPIEMFLKGRLDETRTQHLIEACNQMGVKRVECAAELNAYRLTFHCPKMDKGQLRDLARRVGREDKGDESGLWNDYGE